MSEKNRYVPSPCLRHCVLNEHKVCTGCGRSLDEVTRWDKEDADEQEAILVRAKERITRIRSVGHH
jgi:predicted Fe-S protein YdhL (DUF1289 family)